MVVVGAVLAAQGSQAEGEFGVTFGIARALLGLGGGAMPQPDPAMLEQMQNINSATQRSSTIGLIGHTVSYTQADGSTVEGTVDQVTTVGGKLALTVGGKPGVNPDMVVEVR